MGAVARILATTIDDLVDNRWVNREPKVGTDETCLVVAFGRGAREEYKRDLWAGQAGLIDDARRMILETIEETYPDRRGRGEPMSAFNDHPATKFDDVLGVAREAKRRVDAVEQQS